MKWNKRRREWENTEDQKSILDFKKDKQCNDKEV
jgi:hypothetical protein